MQLVRDGPEQQGKAGFDTERAANFYRFKVHPHADDDDGDNCGDDDYYHHYCYVDVMMIMMMIAKLCKLFLL